MKKEKIFLEKESRRMKKEKKFFPSRKNFLLLPTEKDPSQLTKTDKPQHPKIYDQAHRF
ncbi:MAG: hypothetical protein J5814_00805 [Bacteroidaceae bacterium]|nr:hypothetical protein [Bacteroidaceae bacterium]